MMRFKYLNNANDLPCLPSGEAKLKVGRGRGRQGGREREMERERNEQMFLP